MSQPHSGQHCRPTRAPHVERTALDLVAPELGHRRRSARRLTPAEVRRARRVVERCATRESLRRYSALPERSWGDLAARIGRRLSPTEERIYACVRRAVRSGKAGLYVTIADLVGKVDRCERSVQDALEKLGDHRTPCGGRECDGVKLCEGCERPCPPGCRRHVDLVRTIPQFDEAPWTEISWPTDAERARGLTPGQLKGPRRPREHVLRQTANAYVLGRLGRRPARLTPAQRAVRNAGRDCTPQALSPSSLRSSVERQGGPVDNARPGPAPADPGLRTAEDRAYDRRAAERLARGEGAVWLELAGIARDATGQPVPPWEVPERDGQGEAPCPVTWPPAPGETAQRRDDIACPDTRPDDVTHGGHA